MTSVLSIDHTTCALRLADLSTGKAVKEVKLAAKPWSIAVSCDGHAAVAADDDLRIINAKSLAEVQKLGTGFVATAAYSPDGKWLAAGGRAVLLLFDAPSYEKKASKTEHASPILAISFAPSSDKLATGSSDKSSIIWGLPNLNVLQKIAAQADAIRAVAFLSNHTLATGSNDAALSFWNVSTGSSLKQLKEHAQSVSSLAVSPSGKLFATGSDDKTVKIFESTSYKCLQTIACANWVYRVCFASDDVVLAGIESSELVSFSVSTGKVKATFAKHVSPKGIAILGAGMPYLPSSENPAIDVLTGLDDSGLQ